MFANIYTFSLLFTKILEFWENFKSFIQENKQNYW